jgi:hypothetical protein
MFDLDPTSTDVFISWDYSVQEIQIYKITYAGVVSVFDSDMCQILNTSSIWRVCARYIKKEKEKTIMKNWNAMQYQYFKNVAYLSKRYNWEESQKANNKEKSNYPSQFWILKITCVFGLISYMFTHSKEVTPKSSCSYKNV